MPGSRLDRLQVAADAYLAHDDEPGCVCIYCAAAAEIKALRSWKAEATEVIGSWEQVWEALGRPGRLGESKAEAVLRAVASEASA